MTSAGLFCYTQMAAFKAIWPLAQIGLMLYDGCTDRCRNIRTRSDKVAVFQTARGAKELNCHQTVTKIGAEQANISELRKTEMLLSDGWQRDLVEFCIR